MIDRLTFSAYGQPEAEASASRALLRRAGRSFIQTSIALCLFASVHCAGQASLVQIELRPNAEVTSSKVLLKDIARLSGSDAGTLSRLGTLSLGHGPTASQRINLDRDTLGRWIRRRTGISAEEIQWTGARVCSIQLAVQLLPGPQLSRCAQDHLKKAVAHLPLKVNFSIRQEPQDLRIPAGKVHLKARKLGDFLEDKDSAGVEENQRAHSSFAKRQIVWVEVWVDERFVRTVPVSFDLEAMGQALVANRDLRNGEVAGPKDLRTVEMDWSGRKPFPTPAPVQTGTGNRTTPEADSVEASQPALIMRRPVKAGEPLSQTQAEVAPAVIRGEQATLRVQQGMINLESRVEVLQDGRVGQTIRVKIPNASSSVQAKVVGPGLLEVRP